MKQMCTTPIRLGGIPADLAYWEWEAPLVQPGPTCTCPVKHAHPSNFKHGGEGKCPLQLLSLLVEGFDQWALSCDFAGGHWSASTARAPSAIGARGGRQVARIAKPWNMHCATWCEHPLPSASSCRKHPAGPSRALTKSLLTAGSQDPKNRPLRRSRHSL
ncbi:uncharacterized protein LOC144147103 isoform X2 [Haemaphysalis longicornis]